MAADRTNSLQNLVLLWRLHDYSTECLLLWLDISLRKKVYHHLNANMEFTADLLLKLEGASTIMFVYYGHPAETNTLKC